MTIMHHDCWLLLIASPDSVEQKLRVSVRDTAKDCAVNPDLVVNDDL